MADEYDPSSWPKGPWNDGSEPDKVQWRTKVGLPGLIVRGPWGSLCGYAAVNPGHPLHGQPYDTPEVSVHGGLTYANACQEDGLICHIPEPGEPADVWWFGFDCGHWDDVQPAMEHIYTRIEGTLGGVRTYRDIEYVKAEVEALAGQLAELA